MPISGDSHSFNVLQISSTPTSKGVYSLHKGGETIYIGKAKSEGGIKEKLQSHMKGDEGTCSVQATSFRYELHKNPTAREEELLLEYRYAHGRLPLCNKHID